MLGDRQRDAGDVGFLKRVRANQLAADLAGDADDGRGVHHRGGDAGDHVGRARTRGRDGHADAAARARIAVGHVRGALLVADQHVPDRVLEHRVVGGQNRAAGVAEDVGHALTDETLPQNLRTGQLLSSSSVRNRSHVLSTGSLRPWPTDQHQPNNCANPCNPSNPRLNLCHPTTKKPSPFRMMA